MMSSKAYEATLTKMDKEINRGRSLRAVEIGLQKLQDKGTPDIGKMARFWVSMFLSNTLSGRFDEAGWAEKQARKCDDFTVLMDVDIRRDKFLSLLHQRQFKKAESQLDLLTIPDGIDG